VRASHSAAATTDFEPDEGGTTVTVDLDDGQWRRTDRPLHGLDVPDLAADDIWVKRDGRLLTGVDAATGQALWTFEAPDDEMTFTVRHGTVVVTHDAALNKRLTALAGQDVETAFTLLDARTGRITGRLNLPQESLVPAVVGIAPGRAIVAGEAGSGVLGR